MHLFTCQVLFALSRQASLLFHNDFVRISGLGTLSLIVVFGIWCASCGDDESGFSLSKGSVGLNEEWLIPSEEVVDAGAGKDGIPALENPKFIPVSEVDYLHDKDLVIGYKYNNKVRAYPLRILNWHEIINDDLDGRKIAITHCPLTGTSLGWERTYQGKTTTFGVSGLLYNTNLMPYDRTTNSIWTQIGEQCVNGELMGIKARTFQIFETEWKTWKTMYPNSMVLSTDTGRSRNYFEYPYGDYRTTNSLFYPVSLEDSRLFPKERVHGIISSDGVSAKLYRFDSFGKGRLITDDFSGQNIVIGSKSKNFIISFKQKKIANEILSFTIINDFKSPEILQDQFGNTWDVFGNAVSGPHQGERMVPTHSFIGMFFSWAPFYGEAAIFN